ncbi:hypothetical protein ACOMHN_059538 [Nucella lapillus]
MLMMRAKVQGHRWVDHPAAAVMEARVPGQWVDRPAAMVMEAREQGRCWIDHPAAAVMEASNSSDRMCASRQQVCLSSSFFVNFLWISLEFSADFRVGLCVRTLCVWWCSPFLFSSEGMKEM